MRTCQHDDRRALVLPDHAPESLRCLIRRSLPVDPVVSEGKRGTPSVNPVLVERKHWSLPVEPVVSEGKRGAPSVNPVIRERKREALPTVETLSVNEVMGERKRGT